MSCGFKYTQGSQAGSIGYEEEVSPTLTAGNCPAVLYEKMSFIYNSSNQDVVGTICARDSKGVGNEYVQEGKLLIFKVNNEKPTTVACVINNQGGSSINFQEEIAPTLRAQAHGNEPIVVIGKDIETHIFREGSFAQYVEGEFGTLRYKGGALGGGSETVVLYERKQ